MVRNQRRQPYQPRRKGKRKDTSTVTVSKMDQKEFGNVGAGKLSDHPSLARQREEIAVLKRNITPEEVEIAIDTYVRIKYDRLKNADYWDQKEIVK